MAVLVDPATWFKALAATFFIVTLAKPTIGIGAFLLILPFLGGGRPDELHTIRFISLLAITDLALCLNMLRSVLFANHKPVTLQLSHPLAFCFGIYWLVALMSLSSIPPKGSLYLFEWPDSLAAFAFLSTNEIQYIYSWKSFSILSLASLFAVGIINTRRENEQSAIYWVFCILGGLVISLILGPLDFYDVIDLSNVRPPAQAEMWGASYRNLRAMSLFGNPGWFAQFCTMATPAVLALLTIRIDQKKKIVAIIGIMVLTEFNLLLTQSRGGWLSYPLTLIAVWFAIYVLSHDTQKLETIKAKAVKSLGKIIISVPVTILLSLVLIASFANFQAGQEHDQKSVETPAASAYVDRARNIADTGARTGYWQAAVDMVPHHPILGAGHDSYGYRYSQFYLFEGAPLANSVPHRTVKGSAHNLYFQTAMGKGMVGLLSLIALLAVAVLCGWRSVFASTSHDEANSFRLNQQLIGLISLCAALAVGIYGNVGEIFYIPANSVLFATFLALGTNTGEVKNQQRREALPRRRKIVLLIILAFLFHLAWEYKLPKNIDLNQEISPPVTGCSHLEQADSSEPFHWCGKRFRVDAPIYQVSHSPMAFLSLRPHFPPHAQTVDAEIFFAGRHLRTYKFDQMNPTDIWVLLPKDYRNVNGMVNLQVRLSTAFIPFLTSAQSSNDKRLLSARWMPSARVQKTCYGFEGTNLPKDQQFRWCPSNFDVKLPVECESETCLASITLSPEGFSGATKPVQITFSQNETLVYKATLPRGSLTRLTFPVEPAGPGDSISILKAEVDWAAVPAVTYGNEMNGDFRLLSVRWHPHH